MTRIAYLARSIVLVILLTLTNLPPSPVQAKMQSGDSTPVEFVHAWMKLVYDLVQAERLSPPVAARLYGYSGLALYESWVANMPNRPTLVGQLNEMPAMPRPQLGVAYDWPSVTAAAMQIVVGDLLLRPLNRSRDAIKQLYDAQITQRRVLLLGNNLSASAKLGEQIGQTILNWAAGDRFMFTRGLVFSVPGGNPELWIAPAPNGRPVEPYWSRIRPFILSTSDVCNVLPKVPFSTVTTSAFYAQALEAKQAVYHLTAEQKQIADFWSDAAGRTSTPPGHWVSIAMQLAQQQQLSSHQAATLYATLGIALHDAFVSAWDLKYRVNLIRPDTYINRYIDANWSPYLPTPAFPEYPSGHSVGSGAAAIVLTHIFGTLSFTDTTHVARGLPARHFDSFNDAAMEASLSRLYGGIHFREAIMSGLAQGECVGTAALRLVFQ